MKDYEDIRVPMTCSVPIWLLKAFDEVAKKKNLKRSGMVTELMKKVVEKERGKE